MNNLSDSNSEPEQAKNEIFTPSHCTAIGCIECGSEHESKKLEDESEFQERNAPSQQLTHQIQESPADNENDCESHPISPISIRCKVINCTKLPHLHQYHQYGPMEIRKLQSDNAQLIKNLEEKCDCEQIKFLLSQLKEIQLGKNTIELQKSVELMIDGQDIIEYITIQENSENYDLRPNQQNPLEIGEQLQNYRKFSPPQHYIQKYGLVTNIMRSDDFPVVNEFFDKKLEKLELIYRGTCHGFYCEDFHYYCDNQGPTLIVTLSEHDQISGGFTSIPWTSPKTGQEKADPSAFIFSLNKRVKLYQDQNKHRAVYHYYRCAVAFGGIGKRWDYKIGLISGQGFNQQGTCMSNFDNIEEHTYSLPPGYQENVDEVIFLAGAQEFCLKEIEVFRVTLRN